MKKLALIVFFLALLVVSNGQEPKKTDHKTNDYVMMKDNKMVVVKDGKSMAMEKEMTLADGTRVMVDGKVMMADGSTKILKDGESISLSGLLKKKKEPTQ
jgi:RNase P/RNase MRP subunit p29